MSFINKLKQRIEEVQQVAEKKIIEIKVESEIREARLAECKSCEHLFKPTNSCLKCGCFVQAKTWLKTEKCPIGKW